MGVDRVDSDIVAQVYHNYACFLIKDHQINRGLDVAKDAESFSIYYPTLLLLPNTHPSQLTLMLTNDKLKNV